MAKTTADLLATCRAILTEYPDQITLRRLYHRPVAAHMIENSLRQALVESAR